MGQQPSPFEFNPADYGPAVEQLYQIEAPYALLPTRPVAAARQPLAALDHAALFGESALADHQMADACRSGLWLWFDFLDESHEISQDLKTSTGSYWHGIMHRREGDFSNAKYWFRQTGDHPVFAALSASAAPYLLQADLPSTGQAWDPFAFVDACQQASTTGGEHAELFRQIARVEWQILFDYCYRAASG